MAEGGTSLVFNTSEKLKEDSLKLYNSMETESVVNEFIAIDKALFVMRNVIKAVKDRLDSNWDGQASEAYMHQFTTLWNKMNDFGNVFSDFKNLLCEVDTAFRDTDNTLENSMQENAANSSKQEKPPEEEKKEKERESDLGPRQDADLTSDNLQKGEQQHSTMENAQDPNLNYDPLQNKDNLHSTMDNPEAANLDSTPLQQKDNLHSTMGDIQDPNIVFTDMEPKDVLTSTMGAAENANLDYTPLDPKDVLTSTMEAAQDANLEYTPLEPKDVLSSTMGAAQDAVLDFTSMDQKDYLSSTMEAAQDAALDFTSMEPKDVLSSTMEAAQDAVLGFDAMELVDALYSTMDGALPADLVSILPPQKDYLFSTMEAAIEAALPLNAWLSRTAFGTVMNSIGLDGLGPSIQYASMLIDKYGSSGLDLKLSDITGNDPNAPILGDYMMGSAHYRAVKENILSGKVTRVLTDCCIQGMDIQQASSMVGDAILMELVPADFVLSAEDRSVYTSEIGNRVMNLISRKEGELTQTSSMININPEVWHDGKIQEAVKAGLLEAGVILKETKGLDPIIKAEDMEKTNVISGDLDKLLNYRTDHFDNANLVIQTDNKAFEHVDPLVVGGVINQYEQKSRTIDALTSVMKAEGGNNASLWTPAVPPLSEQIINGGDIVFLPSFENVTTHPHGMPDSSEPADTSGTFARDMLEKFKYNLETLQNVG